MAENVTLAGETDIDRRGRIRFSESAFQELAHGKGSPAVVRALWDGQWSRRMIMLLAFHRAASTDAALFGPLPPIAAAWKALEDAQEAAPAEVAALIMHPQVGNWLAYALRRHRGGAQSPAPMHTDFGQFNALALAAAAIARLPFATAVPLRSGRVMVPRLGMAHFSDCADWDVAEAVTENGRIWFRRGDEQIDVPEDAVDADGWWHLPQVTVGEKPALTLWLDHLDPMRDLADPVAPARLDAAEFGRWTALLDDAWTILTRDHAELAAALAAGVTSLVPLPRGEGWDTRSASTGEAFGAIMCSPPTDAETLAVSLAHEFMHIKLGGLMHLVPLTKTAGTPSLYAPWRDDPRPPSGLLQGVYAFFGIAAFWRQQHLAVRSEDRLYDFEYAYARMQTAEALDIVRSAGGLTEHGFTFTDGLAQELASWATDDVDQEATALARLVADGHRAGWRIRHCRPATTDIDALAELWPDSPPTPLRLAPSTVLPDPEMRHWSAGRLGLARRRLLTPDRYHDVRADDWATDLTDADLALFAGDADTAVKGFTEQLIADADANAWTGLGLALTIASPGPAARSLLNHPEVVREIHHRLSARAGEKPAPAELADWVGRALAH